jgi:hypothetical protein
MAGGRFTGMAVQQAQMLSPASENIPDDNPTPIPRNDVTPISEISDAELLKRINSDVSKADPFQCYPYGASRSPNPHRRPGISFSQSPF